MGIQFGAGHESEPTSEDGLRARSPGSSGVKIAEKDAGAPVSADDGLGALSAPAAERGGRLASWGGRWYALALGLLFVVALLTRAIGLGGAVTEDEDQWIARSGTFANGLATGAWQRTYLTGHPGVTVMWLTTLTLGLDRTAPFERAANAPDVTTVPDFLPALARARVPFIVLQAGLVALAAVLVGRLLGAGIGLIAGLLLAADPFWVGVGPVVGMDGLLSGFLSVSLLALLLACGLGVDAGDGPVSARARVAWSTLSGVAFAFAFLTKTTALFVGPVVPALALLAGWQAWRLARARAGSTTRWWLAPMVIGGSWLVAAGLVIWAVWPAAWMSPVSTLVRAVTFSARLGGTPHAPGNFLLGEPIEEPGALFYPVALAVRIGPATMLGLLLLFVFGAGASMRRALWSLVAFVGLFLLLLTLAPKKVDRYLLPILPMLGVLAAVGWLELGGRVMRILNRRRIPLPPTPGPVRGRGGEVYAILLAAVLAFGVQLWPVIQAGRYPLAAYNPLIGGVRTAERAIPVGWGDGLDVAGERIRELSGGREVTTAIWAPLRVSFGAHAPGPVVSERMLAQADFYVDYIHARQRRLTPRQVASRTPTAVVNIGGVDYVRIYQLR